MHLNADFAHHMPIVLLSTHSQLSIGNLTSQLQPIYQSVLDVLDMALYAIIIFSYNIVSTMAIHKRAIRMEGAVQGHLG